MMKKLFSLCLLMLVVLSGYAQSETEARNLLKSIAEKVNPKSGVQVVFSASSQGGGESLSGTICFKDKKYYLNTPSLQVWYDGKTQWSYSPDTEEVNISVPTPEERQATNPYSFLNFNPQSYYYSISQKNATNTVLKIQDKGRKGTDIYVTVKKATLLPETIKAKQGTKWVTIQIKSLKTQMKWGDAFFRFDAKKYPHAEIIDLR